MAPVRHRSNASTAQQAVDSADKIINTNDRQAAQKQEQHLKQLRTRAKAAFTRWATAQERVLILEDNLKIAHEERWKPGSHAYDDALSELVQREYRLAIDNLERLVVQRLFELAKLGMSGLGAAIFRTRSLRDLTPWLLQATSSARKLGRHSRRARMLSKQLLTNTTGAP